MNTTRHGGLAAICAFFVCLGLAGSVLAADPDKKPDGFRGIAWGTEAASHKDLSLVETDGDFTDYDRTGDKKDLGGMPVEMVTYGFYKGKFYHAAIAYAGATGFAAVQEHLSLKYGPPDVMTERTDDAGRTYVLAAWNWPGYAYIGHRRYTDGSAGRVFYFYSPLVEASKAAAASSVATAAMDPQAPGAGKASATQPKPRPEREARPETSGAADRPLPVASKDRPAAPEKPAPSPAPQAAVRPAPPVSDASGGGMAHIVEKGDMLSALAKRYGVSRNDILAANPGINPTNLKLGQTLRIPAGGKARANAPANAPAEAPAAGTVPEPGRETVPEAEPTRAEKPEPVKTPGAVKKTAPGTHVIAQGDMISALAKRYGVTEKAILKANPGLKPGNLKLGAVIRLPHGATTGTLDASEASESAVSAPKSKPEAKPESTPESKSESKSESKPGFKPEVEAESVSGAKGEVAPGMAASPVKPGPKTEPMAEFGGEATPEVKSGKTPQPGPEAALRIAGPEPGTAPKAEAALGPRSEPTPEPNVEAKAAADGGQKAQAGRPREHVLEFDDTVSGLAKRYRVTTAAILKANPGLDPKKLKPGRKIKIP